MIPTRDEHPEKVRPKEKNRYRALKRAFCFVLGQPFEIVQFKEKILSFREYDLVSLAKNPKAAKNKQVSNEVNCMLAKFMLSKNSWQP